MPRVVITWSSTGDLDDDEALVDRVGDWAMRFLNSNDPAVHATVVQESEGAESRES